MRFSVSYVAIPNAVVHLLWPEPKSGLSWEIGNSGRRHQSWKAFWIRNNSGKIRINPSSGLTDPVEERKSICRTDQHEKGEKGV